jgi:hypothetical protein
MPLDMSHVKEKDVKKISRFLSTTDRTGHHGRQRQPSRPAAARIPTGLLCVLGLTWKTGLLRSHIKKLELRFHFFRVYPV